MSLPFQNLTSTSAGLALAVAACLCGAADAASKVTVSLIPSAAITPPGTEVDVTVRLGIETPAGETPTVALGAQVALRFDAALLEAILPNAVQNAPKGSFALNPSSTTVDSAAGTITFFVLDPTFAGVSTTADLAVLRMRVKDGVDSCGGDGLVWFDAVGGISTEIAVNNGTTVVPNLADLPDLNIDDEAPSLSVVPTTVTVPTDAGSTVGAVVAEPTVVATDNCDATVSVVRVVTLAGGATSSAWPAEFPIGTSTVEWTASDEAGNTAVETQTITVENHQLMDAVILIPGATRDSNIVDRSIRFKVRSTFPTQTVTMYPDLASNRFEGLAMSVPVPVAASYACLCAKDLGFSVSAIDSTIGVVGTRYRAEFTLVQGDLNNDDLVDIVDFGAFLLREGQAAATDGQANFNADGWVNSADFSFIAINYFQTGLSCGDFTAGAPRSRISIKELRRMGLGELASGDLNRDGWLDQQDVQQYLGHGGASAGASERMTPARW